MMMMKKMKRITKKKTKSDIDNDINNKSKYVYYVKKKVIKMIVSK